VTPDTAPLRAITTKLLTVEVVEADDGAVTLNITAHGKGKIAKAKLGVMPLPLKLAVKDGTKLTLTVEPKP
jgi:hypothetical protein